MDEKNLPRIPTHLEEQLRLRRLRPELEPLARELVELASAGSRELWPELTPERLKDDADFRRKFHVLAHDGMYKAQERMVERILTGVPLDVSETILFRGVADSIAWAMIGGQLCYARRLYREQKQPDLAQSNFESVVAATRAIRERDPGCMPLITDLTSFIQVGDLMCVSPSRRMTLIEVKQGNHNKHVLNLVSFYQKSGCERFREILTQTERSHTVKQFERVMRQEARMEFIGELMGKGFAKDPDTRIDVSIPEQAVHMESWDEALNELIKRAREKNWAYEVQGSLFMGAYWGDPWSKQGHLAFLGALGLVRDLKKDFCIIRLAGCMNHPLAPPIFSRQLEVDTMFDLLFGRLNVCVAVSVPDLIHECEMAGLDSRVATRKELAEARRTHADPVLVDGKGVMFGLEGREMLLLGGIIFRALFHGQRPASVIRGYLESSDEMPEPPAAEVGS